MLEKVMITNKKLKDPDLIYDGAVLIWNVGLPFLNANHRQFVYKTFQAASSLMKDI